MYLTDSEPVNVALKKFTPMEGLNRGFRIYLVSLARCLFDSTLYSDQLHLLAR